MKSKSEESPTGRRTKSGRAAPPVYHSGPPIDGEAALAAALDGLIARDPEIVNHMIAVGGPPPLRLRPPGFEGLVSIILSQQVSVASANAIAARVATILVPLTPAVVAAADDATMKACGLSAPKIRTLRAVSAAVISGDLLLEKLAGMDAAEAHRVLVSIKGIGPWTADIFLLFCLGHPDAWPSGDIALQEAARLVLKLDERPDAPTLHALGERWRPYRGVAARLLWACYRVAKQGREGFDLAKL